MFGAMMVLIRCPEDRAMRLTIEIIAALLLVLCVATTSAAFAA